jgi:hypothetical protein
MTPYVVHRTREIPSNYELWNSALADRFFPLGQTQPVYLDPDDAALAELAGTIGVRGDPVEAFIESVKQTLWLTNPSSFLYFHDEWFDAWRSSRRDETPTVVGLLALFSFASTRMEDDRGYYKPLCQLLGAEDVDEISRCYNRRVRHYWSALNTWIETSGRGIPTAYPQDVRANVSLLLTQRFLSAAERAMLPMFFEGSGLVPGTTLTLPEMEDQIRRNVHHLPTELMGEWRRHPDRFVEVASIELESWTGQQSADDTTNEGPLMLGLYFDRRRESVQFPLATAPAAPPGEYFFEGATDESDAIRYAVDELGGVVMFDADDGPRFSRGPRLSSEAIAALLKEEVEITSKSGFKLRRKRSNVTLFMPLSASSYLETPGRRLPLGVRFALLAAENVAREPAFSQLTGGDAPVAIDGCPLGWRLYRDVELRTPPNLSPATSLSGELERLIPLAHDAVIDLRGGVPLAGPTRAGRAWLACCLPQITVAGEEKSVEVQLHLRPSDGSEEVIESLVPAANGSFGLPENGSLPPGDHQVFVITGSRTLTQKKLRVVSSDTPRGELRLLAHAGTGAWGAVSANGEGAFEPHVRGAYWDDLEPYGDLQRVNPPVSLARPIEEPEDELTPIGLTRDVRPEKYRHGRRRRRRATLRPLGHESSLLDTILGPALEEAVALGAEEFDSADGKRWRIKYFDDNSIVVRPLKGFVPLARFRVFDQ